MIQYRKQKKKYDQDLETYLERLIGLDLSFQNG